jgi:hypothetical protein
MSTIQQQTHPDSDVSLPEHSTATANRFPEPAGAVRIEGWELGDTGADGAPHVLRDFTGSSWTVERAGHNPGNVDVTITGIQHGDGTTQRAIIVDRLEAYEHPLSIHEAEQLRDALTEAIDDAHEAAIDDEAAAELAD